MKIRIDLGYTIYTVALQLDQSNGAEGLGIVHSALHATRALPTLGGPHSACGLHVSESESLEVDLIETAPKCQNPAATFMKHKPEI